jgi:nucleoside 2-deoxyribosyltransferase
MVRQIVIECGCFRVLTISPPRAFGGLIMRNVDMFDHIFDAPYGQDLVPRIVDMLNEAIGVIRTRPERSDADGEAPAQADIAEEVMKNYAFVAMPMDPKDHKLGDVLDAIKEAAKRCGVQAERVDDVASNERITDRILESIRKAEFVIADLTNAKPNVYFEAGYAHGLRKTPIYIAADGTTLEFDLNDYPVIFFKNLRELKNELERRLTSLAGHRSGRLTRR